MQNSCIRIFSNKGERPKPRLQEGSIQGTFEYAQAGEIGAQWIH